MKYDYHTYEVVDGKLVIYGVVHKVVKLAEYNIRQNEQLPLEVQVEPTLSEEPVALQNDEPEKQTITVNDLDFS